MWHVLHSLMYWGLDCQWRAIHWWLWRNGKWLDLGDPSMWMNSSLDRLITEVNSRSLVGGSRPWCLVGRPVEALPCPGPFLCFLPLLPVHHEGSNMPHAPVTLKAYINESILKRHFRRWKQWPWRHEIVQESCAGRKCRAEGALSPWKRFRIVMTTSSRVRPKPRRCRLVRPKPRWCRLGLCGTTPWPGLLSCAHSWPSL